MIQKIEPGSIVIHIMFRPGYTAKYSHTVEAAAVVVWVKKKSACIRFIGTTVEKIVPLTKLKLKD